jgi:hypothetical protein
MESKRTSESELLARWRDAANEWVTRVWSKRLDCVRRVDGRAVLLPLALDAVKPSSYFRGVTMRAYKPTTAHVFGLPPVGVPYLLKHWTVKRPVYDDLPERVETCWARGSTPAGEDLARASEALAAAVSSERDASVLLDFAGTFPIMTDEERFVPGTKEQAEAYQRAERWVTTFCVKDSSDCARVSYDDAVNGRPDLRLPPTHKSTLRRWIQNEQAASDLGVNCKGSIVAQEPLVSALIKRHEIQKHRPPSTRKK